MSGRKISTPTNVEKKMGSNRQISNPLPRIFEILQFWVKTVTKYSQLSSYFYHTEEWVSARVAKTFDMENAPHKISHWAKISILLARTVGKNIHFWRIKICQNLKFHDLKVAYIFIIKFWKVKNFSTHPNLAAGITYITLLFDI